MTSRLPALTLGLLAAGIVMESLGAPYRLVQGVVILGVVALVLQIPDMVGRSHRVRDRDADQDSTDDKGAPKSTDPR